MEINRDEFNGALYCAIKMLSRRPASVKELTGKLFKKGFEQEDISATIDRLCEAGFLNDEQYAEILSRHYLQRGYGAKKIRHELLAHGISEEIADNLCLQNKCEDVEDKVYSLFRSRLKSECPDQKEINRAVQFLLRRGFSWSEISPALKRIKSVDFTEFND